jgi:hypothetical protein
MDVLFIFLYLLAGISFFGLFIRAVSFFDRI